MGMLSKAVGVKYNAETDEELRLATRVGAFVRGLTERDDILGRLFHNEKIIVKNPFTGEDVIDPKTGEPQFYWKHPAAHWVPGLAEIGVSIEHALDDVEDLDSVSFVTPAAMSDVAKLTGAIMHEASHAVHTQWVARPGQTSAPLEFMDAAKAIDEGVTDRSKMLGGLLMPSIVVLEESRCERNHIERRPGDRRFIRACINEIVKQDADALDEHPVWGAAHAAALMLARVDSGVLEEDDIPGIRDIIIERLSLDGKFDGAIVLEDLRRVWNDNFLVEDEDFAGLADCGRRWVETLRPLLEVEREEAEALREKFMDFFKKLMDGGFHGEPSPGAGEPGDEEGEGKGSGSSKPGDEEGDEEGAGSGGDGEGDEEGDTLDSRAEGGDAYHITDTSGIDDDPEDEAHADDGKAEARKGGHGRSLGGAVRKAAEGASSSGERELSEVVWERIRDTKADREEAARREEARKALGKAREVAASVFRRNSDGTPQKASRAIVGERVPTPEERAAAVKIGRQLDQAKYRDRQKTRVTSTVPPGRLRGRGAVSWKAQRARGDMVTAQPWRRNERRHVDETTLTIGIMTDVSGSMGMSAAPQASAGWILANAGHRIQARVASVTFGDHVDSIVYPNSRPEKVTEFSCHGGSEAFKKGFLALDGALTLLGGSGARLLVVSSDNHLVNSTDAQFRTEVLPKLLKDGVGVLWLSWGSITKDGLPDGVEVVDLGRKPGVTEAAATIAAAAKRAIEKASQG